MGCGRVPGLETKPLRDESRLRSRWGLVTQSQSHQGLENLFSKTWQEHKNLDGTSMARRLRYGQGVLAHQSGGVETITLGRRQPQNLVASAPTECTKGCP